MVFRVLLVGSGITSSLTSAFIRKKLQNSVYLEVWDKSTGVGGRMSTSKSPEVASGQLDIGAQFITITPKQFVKNQELYESMIGNGLILPLTAHVEGMKLYGIGKKLYIAPDGMNAIVDHFMQSDDIKFEHHVDGIDTLKGKASVRISGGGRGIFDAVILTMPVPEILEITEDMIQDEKLRSNLMNVKYSSRYALGLFYSRPSTNFKVPWDAKFIDNDDVFQFVSFDNRKRNRKCDPDSCVFHTSVPFGCENVDQPIEDVVEKLVEHVRDLFPTWPEPCWITCRKWRYSHVVQPYIYKPGHVIIQDRPLVVAGGDGFTESNFHGCVSSAKKIAQVVTDKLTEEVQ